MENKVNISAVAQKKIIAFLEEDPDFNAAKYMGEYKGSYVFSSATTDGRCPMVGYPPFYLVTGDKVKMIDYTDDLYDELMKI